MVRGATERLLLSAVVLAAAGCARPNVPSVAPHPVAAALADGTAEPSASATHSLPSCVECSAPPTSELAAAIEARVADLKARGGECEEYGIVLEDALTSGRIAIRPYMWRVQGNLASAQGESSGEMTIARDIDSLNVGVRGLDEVLRSAEHEAAHIALRIASGDPVREARVDERVNSCRAVSRERH